MIRLANNLRVEKSQSVSLSADLYRSWGDWQGNLMIEGFFTDLADVFALKEIGFQDGVLIKERHNESGARVFGGNLEGKVAWRDKVQVQAGLTAQNSRYKEARTWSDEGGVEATRKMFRTPDFYGYLSASYNPIKRMQLSLTGTYTESMLIEHHAGFIDSNKNVETPDFWDLNFKIAYDFKIYSSFSLQLNAGVQNMLNSFQKDFDSGADRDSGYIYGPTLPRSFFLGIKLNY
jgi:outer membrane receptor for ferrienterochelin and colicins